MARREVKFESQERRMANVLKVLNQYGIKSIEEADEICESKGIDPYKMAEETQPICFENVKWAYTCGAAIAIKKGCKTAAEAAEAIGEGLQSFCIDGSVADDRKVGIGHGNLAARLLREETECFARRPSASPSWPATKASPPLKAPSRSPKWPTRCARSPCA